MATNLSSYDAFYAMLDMIPCSKVLEKSGKKPPELTKQNKVELAEIYDILQLPLNATKQDFVNAYEKALRVIIKVFNNLNISKGTKAIGGNDYNDSKPPEGASSVPEEIKRAIYFVTYLAYVYRFGIPKDKNTIGRAGFQAQVLERIKTLSGGTVTFGKNTWTKWGLHPEHDFIEGTYNPEKLPYRYMGQKNPDLLFMFKTLADSAHYDTFVDLFGGSGVCSLARSYNPSVDEYINDFDFRNVCFYLAMTEHFKEFKKACIDLKECIENRDFSNFTHFKINQTEIYDLGRNYYWNTFAKNICNKLNKILDEIRDDYNNDRVTFSRLGLDGESPIYDTFTWQDFTPENVSSDYPKFYEYVINGESSQCYTYYPSIRLRLIGKSEETITGTSKKSTAKNKGIDKTIKDKKLTASKEEQDSLILALGMYRYFENLPMKFADNDVSINKKINYDVCYAVAFLYMKLFMQVQPSISWVTMENLNKLPSILKDLEILHSRFKTLGVLWVDAIGFLNRPNKINEALEEIVDNPDKKAVILTNSKSYDIFTESECKLLTTKPKNDAIERAKFTVDYYKNMLVYVDSPYISTTGYAESKNGGFNFEAYREAIDNFLGKYIYSCRFSVKTNSKEIGLYADHDDWESKKKRDSTKKVLENLATIYDYYIKFKSIKYVCLYISNYEKFHKNVIAGNTDFEMLSENEFKEKVIKQYIREMYKTDELEVMFTNFDFNLPISDYQGLFKKDDKKEVDTGKKKKGTGNNSKKNTFTFDYDKSVREAGETKFYKLDFKTFMGYVEEVFRELKVPIGTTDCGKVVKKK